MWWHGPTVPALGMKKQADLVFEASLSCMVTTPPPKNKRNPRTPKNVTPNGTLLSQKAHLLWETKDPLLLHPEPLLGFWQGGQ